jgi:DUF1009 family protein
VSETLGLIAGNRSLPFLWTAQAHAAGYKVAAVGFAEETDKKLAKQVDAFQLITLGQLGTLIKFFKAHGVKRAVMQGQIQHKQLYANIKPDWRAQWLLTKQALFVRDFRTEALLKSVGQLLGRHGIELQSALWLMDPWLAGKGRLAGPKPDSLTRRDIAFGVKLATELNKHDVGQTVVVRKQSCVAVESIEGTDACIQRAASLAKFNFTVVKLARPQQDLRFDIPVVGLKTFQTAIKAKAAAMVVQAGKTLFLDKDACLALADKAKLSVLAV